MKFKQGLILMLMLVIAWVGVRKLAAQTPEASTSPEPVITGEVKDVTDEIKQKVQERLAKAAKQKKAYVGTLTDIADSTLKITTKQGIKMAATDEKTILLRVEGGKQTKVKITELPLDQQVIAMGYVENGNGQVLAATRVISSQIPEADLRQVKMGEVADLTKKGEFTLGGVSGESFKIKLGKKVRYTTWQAGEAKELKGGLTEGMKVIVVGVPDKNDETILSVSLIHVVSGGAEKAVVSPTPSPKTVKVSPTPTE